MKRAFKPKTLVLREDRLAPKMALAMAMAWAALEPLEREAFQRRAHIALAAMREVQGGRL